tara:strand:- start:17986 stop:18573 length:588 start_codon:yes stop_codon:yes gene_type:complete
MSTLALTSNTLSVTASAGQIEYNGQFYATDSNASRAQIERLVQGTSQATTSGTSIDFTGIPSWVKRITVMLDAVSTSGTSIVMIRIGPVGGIESTGYAAHSGTIEGSGIGSLDHTTGFGISQAGAAAYTFGGFFTLCNLSGNTWTLSGSARQASTRITMSAGSKTLAGVLTQVRLTTVNGTDTFDAGSINIMYEG